MRLSSRLRITLSAVALLCTTGALIAFNGVPDGAQAAYTRTPSPGPGYVYGVPWSGLPTDCATSPNGGWDRPQWQSYGNGFLTDKTGSTVLQRVVELTEPCKYSGNPTAIGGFRVGAVTYGAGYATSPAGVVGGVLGKGCQTSSNVGQASVYNCLNVTQSGICSTSEWSNTPTTRSYNTSSWTQFAGSTTVPQIGAPNYTVTQFDPSPLSGANCTYLVQVKINVCYFIDNTVAGMRCETATWTAERAFRAAPYNNPDPEQLACQLNWDQPECYTVDPAGFDATDFLVVCANPPVPEWGDFSWVVEGIGYFSDCLFVPQGGWDPGNQITDAWEAGGLFQAGDMVNSIISSITFHEGCGVLLNIDVPSMMGSDLGVLYLNTCDYAASMILSKQILSATFWIMWIMWLISFMIDVLKSFVDRRMPMVIE